MAGGPFDLINNAQLGVYHSALTLGDNTTSVSGGLGITPGFTVSNKAAGFGAAMNTGGGGTVPASSFASGGASLPSAAPVAGTCSDSYVALNTLSGSWPTGNWNLSIPVIATGATVSGSGHFNFRVWVAQQPAGETSTGITLWHELTSGPISTTTWSNLTTSTPQTVTASFNPGGPVAKGVHVFLQIACIIDTASTSTSATVTIQAPGGTLTPPTPFAVQSIGRVQTIAASFTGTSGIAVTFAQAILAGDAAYAFILRTPQTTGGDVTSITDSSGNTWSHIASLTDILGDSSALMTSAYACLNLAAASAGANTLTFGLNSSDSSSIIEVESVVMRAPGFPNSITLGPTGWGQNGGSLGTNAVITNPGSTLTLSSTNTMCVTFGTGQNGDLLPTDGTYLIDSTAANTRLGEQYFTNTGTFTPAWSQSAAAGWQLLVLSMVGPASVSASDWGEISAARRDLRTNAVYRMRGPKGMKRRRDGIYVPARMAA